MAETTERVPPTMTSTHTVRNPLKVIVVGAGGTGGRLIPPLMQVLKRGDHVHIVDGDHVEDRNLLRQNFRTRDIGENKAEVMATRYRRDGINVHAYGAMLTEDVARAVIANNGTTGGGVNPAPPYTIIMGCVDNWKARVTMSKVLQMVPQGLWIDAGNERRGGQVLMSAKAWPFKVQDHNTAQERVANWHLRGMVLAMPQLLEPQVWHCVHCSVDNAPTAERCKKCKQPEDSCRDRIDLQTVAVNQLSATCMLNQLSSILYQNPIASVGTFFSTFNTMSPIKVGSLDWARYEIKPEDTYAASEPK